MAACTIARQERMQSEPESGAYCTVTGRFHISSPVDFDAHRGVIPMRTLLSKLTLAGALLAIVLTPVGGAAKGVSGPAFYINGVLYRTVGTPTDFSRTGAPDSSFDVIYNFFGAQTYNVATAAPGDPGFNGGRWQVHQVTFPDYQAAVASYDANGSGDFDSAAEVETALADGAAIDNGIVREFECTVNRIPRRP
jgi:hypothetical protein